ncbi:MAG: type IV pilus twitching motility protein PilT [Eubacteriaceae bacterium]|jgi:twitching motility protein PilT
MKNNASDKNENKQKIKPPVKPFVRPSDKPSGDQERQGLNRTASALSGSARQAESFPTLAVILRFAQQQKASDIHIGGGEIWIRTDGKLARVRTGDGKAAERACDEAEALTEKRTDCGASIIPGTRQRLHRFRSMGGDCLCIRLLPGQVPDARTLGLTPGLIELSSLRAGMILVAGPTGSGKSTTLAALIREAAVNRACTIVTLEDPAEYDLAGIPECRSLIRQREIGRDIESYEEGLREAMRQDPDLIMIGELRDEKTAEQALKAAETGHLVMSTLHTTDCAQSVDRFLEMFRPESRDSARGVLADVLEAVCVQRLIPAVGGGRVAVREIMRGTPAVKGLIRDGRTHQLKNVIQTSGSEGMVLFDRDLADLVGCGRVAEENALLYAAEPAQLSGYLKNQTPKPVPGGQSEEERSISLLNKSV